MSIDKFLETLAYGGSVCVSSEQERMSDLTGSIITLRAKTLLAVPIVANLLQPSGVLTFSDAEDGGALGIDKWWQR
ncbi:hypothetical protein PG984_010515 [Apiospora sp. TS-2023a]